MSSLSSRFRLPLLPGMGPTGPRLSVKFFGLILFTTTTIILVFSTTTTDKTTSASTILDMDAKSNLGKCATKKMDDLYRDPRPSICIISGAPSPSPPIFETQTCPIAQCSIKTDILFFMLTVLLCAMVPLPLFIYLKRKLSGANGMAPRIIWGLSLFFLIAFVTVYLTELNESRNGMKNCRSAAIGQQLQRNCNWIGVDMKPLQFDGERVTHIFRKVNPFEVVSKTVDILIDGLKRGRERSRVTKFLKKQLENGKEDDK